MGRARKSEENWADVADLRKRKQIQDRMAQRARRKRLKEATESCSKQSDHTSAADGCEGGQKISGGQSQEQSLQLVQLSNHYHCRDANRFGGEPCVGQVTALLYTALRQNGVLLGLRCSAADTRMSLPAVSGIPETLRPTRLQLSVPHATWIDRFPFPQLRDNLIQLWGLIDEEDFLSDLFCLPSFAIAADAPSWDPAGWEVGKEFSAKWGYLFF